MIAERPLSPLLRVPRFRAGDIVFWLAALAVVFVFTGQLAFATSVLIAMTFAMSLNIVLGYSGIITLGHGLHFGIGAYAAALLASGGFREPVAVALVAGLISGSVAAVLGTLVVRLSGLPQIMVTISLAALGYEAANKATWLTHGDDGMQGFTFAPILGLFHQSITGQQSYLYVLAWLFVLFIIVRIIIASPFGAAIQGIRENRARMLLLGAPVVRHLMIAYALSGLIAGIAGALSAETAQFVGLDSLSINRSIDVLLMTVLGGAGHLYGPLFGAAAYAIVHHAAAEWNPYHWMFVIGLLLIVVVRFARGGFVGIFEALRARWAMRARAAA